MCPVCGCGDSQRLYAVRADGTEAGTDSDRFRPSASAYGTALAQVVRCRACGHGSLAVTPSDHEIASAYWDTADPSSLDEEEGRLETARRSLRDIERRVQPGVVVDVGCWTGSFLVAARERGWDPVGLEPSAWASEVARQRGLPVQTSDLARASIEPQSCRLVVMADVLEHLLDPAAALSQARKLLEPRGCLYVTVPDAGSVVARFLGRRWWSVLPMHVQYFTRSSMCTLLGANGFQVVALSRHAKVFTARYYAGRLGGYSAAGARIATRVLERFGLADRLVAPDFRDRLAVVALATV